MKKLLLIAASMAILSTTAAGEGRKNSFYIKANAGASRLGNVTVKDKLTDKSHETKSKTGTILGFGAGYYFMDNVRADLTLDFMLTSEMKKSSKNVMMQGNTCDVDVKIKPTINTLMASVYVDLLDVGVVKIFAAAGLGAAQIKGKIDVVSSNTNTPALNVATAIITTPAGTKITTIPMAATTPAPPKPTVQSGKSKVKYGLAYHFTIGATSEITSGVNVDLSYSYRDLGKMKDIEGITTSSLKGHHLLVGLRFDL